MGRLIAAVLCALALTQLPAVGYSQGLEIPGQAPGESPQREVRPDPPPAQPEAEVPSAEIELQVPPSVTAPVMLDPREPAAIGPPGTLPDELTAGEATYEPDGTLVVRNAKLTVASLITNGGPAIVSAGAARINSATQQVELSGGLSIEVQNVPRGIPLQLAAQAASWDPATKKLSVQGLAVPVPLSDIMGENFPVDEIEPRFASHIKLNMPAMIYVNAGELEVQQVGKEQAVVLRDVEISPSARPGADLYITAREATLTADDQITVSSAAVWLEGVKVFTWPRYTHGTGVGGGVIGFEAPSINLDTESIEARQEITLDLAPLHVESTVAYAEQYDFIAHGYAYLNLWQGGQLGVQHGDIAVGDFRRDPYLRSDDGVVTFRQRSQWDEWRLSVDVEHGEVSSRPITETGLGEQVLTERTAVIADLELTRTRLGGDWYFTAGASARRIDYGVEEYEALGARAGLIYRASDFNNFLLYREHDISGTALLPFDEVRRRQLDFQSRVSLIPRLSHIVRAVYDLDLEDYDRLEVGTLLERRGYEVGFYWDFARERAGIELGLLTP